MNISQPKLRSEKFDDDDDDDDNDNNNNNNNNNMKRKLATLYESAHYLPSPLFDVLLLLYFCFLSPFQFKALLNFAVSHFRVNAP